MTMVGGFDVHRKQITFDYVDDDGLVHWGEIRPATRKTLRGWLGEHCASGDAEFALEGCTGWRYVVEELAMAGVVAHLGDPAEIAGLRGPKKRAKTDRADARLLRTLLVEGRFPESWIPPAHVVEVRTLGRLYCALMEQRRAWQQRIHAQLFHQGCPPVTALLSVAGRDALAGAELSGVGRQYVDTALRRIDELGAEIVPLRAQLVNFARHQRVVGRCRPATTASGGYARRSSGPRSVTRAGFPALISWCASRAWTSPCIPRMPNAHPGICPGKARPSCVGPPSRRPSPRLGAVPPITATTTSWRSSTTATMARTRPWRSNAKSCAAAITRCVNSVMPR